MHVSFALFPRLDLVGSVLSECILETKLTSLTDSMIGSLTGADTVIFYDSDFNPQMDRQCEDR
jgi:hypothetical protein